MPADGSILRTPAQLATAAAGCAAAFVGVLAVAYGSEQAERIDAAAVEDFGRPLREPLLARAAVEISRMADPQPFAMAAVALAVIGLLLYGSREAAAVAVMIGGANIATQVLKPVLATPRGTVGGWSIGPEAFPSGHATAAMSLALAAVFVSRRRWRPLVGLAGAGFAVAVGFSLVAIDAHFPSDVAGGYLMAAGWCFGTQAGLAAAERRWPRANRAVDDEGGAPHRVALVLLGGLTVAAAVGATQLPELVDYARGHTAFAVVAAATAALAALLVAVGVVSGRPAPSRTPPVAS